ncbi:MAG: ribose-phosphate diphosphokinase [Sulfobacillus sp.]
MWELGAFTLCTEIASGITFMKLLTGKSNYELAAGIAGALGIGFTSCVCEHFSNSEIRVSINENVRNEDMVIIPSGSSAGGWSVNDHLMETYIMIDACRRSNARSITVVCPYLPYSRQDKKSNGREPISAKLIIDFFAVAGATRLVSVDLHAPQIQGFTNLPFDNLSCLTLISKHIRAMSADDDLVLVAPDNGAAKMVGAYAKKSSLPYVIMHKQRNYVLKNQVDDTVLVGDPKLVSGKTAVIIDDMIDTCGSMISAAGVLKDNGAKSIVLVATHGILSGPAIVRINECQEISRCIVTNSLPMQGNLERCPKLVVIDISGYVAETIRRIFSGESISEMFERSISPKGA